MNEKMLRVLIKLIYYPAQLYDLRPGSNNRHYSESHRLTAFLSQDLPLYKNSGLQQNHRALSR